MHTYVTRMSSNFGSSTIMCLNADAVHQLSRASCIHRSYASICGRLCSSPYGHLQFFHYPRSLFGVWSSASINQNHKMCLPIHFRELAPPYFVSLVRRILCVLSLAAQYPCLLIEVVKLLPDARGLPRPLCCYCMQYTVG